MSIKKKILLAVILLLVIIQFIRPEKNLGSIESPNHIKYTVSVTPEVDKILKVSCYDCHSNHTEYPWYSNIQPFAWWLNDHVVEGKGELNFSEFNTYKLKRKIHKLEEVIELVEEDEMPLKSYTLLHSEAKLTAEEKEKLFSWAKASIETLKDTLK